MRTTSGLGSGFTAGGPIATPRSSVTSSSTELPRRVSTHLPSCARLPLSSAGGAKAGSAADSHDPRVLPAPGGGADRVCLPIQPASTALPGERRLTSSAGGPHRFGGVPGTRGWAARDCSSLPSVKAQSTATAAPVQLRPASIVSRVAPASWGFGERGHHTYKPHATLASPHLLAPRTFPPLRGLEDQGGQDAERPMSAGRSPNRSLSPLIGGCSTSTAVGAGAPA